ncbi:sensor histidine kinase [Flavobacterium sp. LB2P6]|uniref:sensor histidine kinase n=1 Tax=Flavobacterium sp. LB2P6 TaxID=3401714 RepID=UPI003AAE1C70
MDKLYPYQLEKKKILSMLFFKRNNYLVVFLLLFEVAVTQTIPSKNITVNDGLPSNGIKCFFKDSRGLLWIGTDAGLCCYDGSTYKVFNETNGLKYDKVWSVVEDENKNIWLSLYGNGLAKYDGEKFTYYSVKDGLVNNSIRKIHYSKKYKCLILATGNGLSLFNGKNFKSFIQKNVSNKFQIVGIEETKKEIFITASYSDKYNRSQVFNLIVSGDIKKSSLEKIFKPILSYSSFVDRNTYFSGGPDHFLFTKNLTTKKETILACPIIWDYAKDQLNNLYFATSNVIDPKGGLFKYTNNKITDITRQANITSTSLWCLFYDKETQQLWVGSNDKGIYRVDLSRKIQFLESSYFGLKDLQTQRIYNDINNTTWIGAKDNIILVDKDLRYTIFDKATILKKLSVYFKEKGWNSYTATEFKGFKSKEGFTSFNIVSDNEGNTWVNTTLGVFCFDKKYEIIFFAFFDGGNLIFDNKDQAYFCRMYSDTYLYQNKFDWTHFSSFSLQKSSTPTDITKIVKEGNTLWFASSSKGLFINKNSQFYSLNANGMFKEHNIKDLLINDKGQLVIGTNSGKVYITKWNGKKLDILHVYKPYKELHGTSISFVEQSNGTYFIGTNKGINVVRNNKFIKLINKSEGLTDVQFNDCIKDKSGNLLIATNNGLIQLNVAEFFKNEKAQNTPIRINSIKVNGTAFAKTDSFIRWGVYENNKIKLDYNQNDVEIVFSSNNTFNADKNVFRYKIIGLSDTWSDFESNGRIQLLGIPNGRYKLILEGKNTGTGYMFHSKLIDLIITPPFWKTWWFVLSSVLLFSIIGFVIYKKRIHFIKIQERSKSDIQRRLAETKMEALQSQMNPHFIFNAMNSIQNFIIDNNTDDALMYMGEFSKLIRQTLNNSSKLRINLTDEIQYLQSYITLENMRFKNRVNFELSLDDDLDFFETEIPPMLIQPFMENVFVHAFDSNSKKPTLKVSFKQIEDFLFCEIEDNGKGMAAENLNKLNTSKGIKLAKERITLFQFDTVEAVTISSSPNGGTTVVLKLHTS